MVARAHYENEEMDAERKRIDPKVFPPHSGQKIISNRKLAKAGGVKALTNIAGAATPRRSSENWREFSPGTMQWFYSSRTLTLPAGRNR